MPGIRVKKSKRWGPPGPEVQDMPLPLINHLGQFTGVTLYKVPCTASQYVATVVATVGSRLESLLVRHQGRRVAVKSRWLVARSAYYYAASKNEWFLDRFIALTRNWEKGKKVIFSYLSKFVAKLDAYNRFVYGQVCLQTHWLFTRGPKSVPRDKSFLLESRLLKRRQVGDLSCFFREDALDIQTNAFRYATVDISGLESRKFLYRPHPAPIGPPRPVPD